MSGQSAPTAARSGGQAAAVTWGPRWRRREDTARRHALICPQPETRLQLVPRDPLSLLDEALALPAASRARLAGELLRSLDADGPPLDEDEYDAAWGAELKRRIDEVESGAVKPVPWSVVRGRLAAGE